MNQHEFIVTQSFLKEVSAAAALTFSTSTTNDTCLVTGSLSFNHDSTTLAFGGTTSSSSSACTLFVKPGVSNLLDNVLVLLDDRVYALDLSQLKLPPTLSSSSSLSSSTNNVVVVFAFRFVDLHFACTAGDADRLLSAFRLSESATSATESPRKRRRISSSSSSSADETITAAAALVDRVNGAHKHWQTLISALPLAVQPPPSASASPASLSESSSVAPASACARSLAQARIAVALSSGDDGEAASSSDCFERSAQTLETARVEHTRRFNATIDTLFPPPPTFASASAAVVSDVASTYNCWSPPSSPEKLKLIASLRAAMSGSVSIMSAQLLLDRLPG
jgi:hypothetical protein